MDWSDVKICLTVQIHCTVELYICVMVKIFEAVIGTTFYEDNSQRSVLFACMESDEVALKDVEGKITRNLKTLPSISGDDQYEKILFIREVGFIDMSSDRDNSIQLTRTVSCYTHIDII